MTPEEKRAYQREYRRKHPEKFRQYMQNYAEAHPERVEKQKEYNKQAKRIKAAKDKEIVAQAFKPLPRTEKQQRRHEYYLQHKEEYKARGRLRRLNMTPEEREAYNEQHRKAYSRRQEVIKLARELTNSND